jgi:NitT/TauT family transport system permease protein
VKNSPFSPGHPPGGVVYTIGGVLFLFVLWQMLAMTSNKLAIASPLETARALAVLLGTPPFHEHFWVTLGRVFTGIFLGGTIGFVLGVAAGLRREVYLFLEPLRWISMSIPPVTILVLALFYLGLGTAMVITFAVLMLWPIIYVNTVKGMQLVDRDLEEMACLYKFPLGMRVRRLYVPALAAPLGAGLVQVVCSGLRIVILAEVFGAMSGIGAAIQTSSSNLEVPQLFAWVMLSLLLVGIAEFALLGPIHRRLTRWYTP